MYRLKIKPRWFDGAEYRVSIITADEKRVIYFDPYKNERNERDVKSFLEKFTKV